ncbi:hypothetical protein ACFWP1_36495, partial [Streptomyces sp. NPDC058425]
FGTLLSSQGTDASFVLTPANRLRLSSGHFPFGYYLFCFVVLSCCVLAFPTLSVFFRLPDHRFAGMRKTIREEV